MSMQIASTINGINMVGSVKDTNIEPFSFERAMARNNVDSAGTTVKLSESSYSAQNKDELPPWTKEAAAHYDTMSHKDAMESLENYATADDRSPLIDITRINEGIITYTHTGELVTPESKEKYMNISRHLTNELTSIFNAEKEKNTPPGEIFLKFQEVIKEQPDDYLNKIKWNRENYNPFS